MPLVSIRVERPVRATWLAAARRFRAALEATPGMKVQFFSNCTENMAGDSWTCDVVTLRLDETLTRGDGHAAIDEERIARATDAELNTPDAREAYTVLMYLDQQIQRNALASPGSSVPWVWLGLGALVLGGTWFAWRLVKNGR